MLYSVGSVLKSGWLTQGPVVKTFEGAIAKYVRARYAVAVSSCTAALYLALRALGVGRGDEVIIPDFTFPATGNVVLEVGGTPVLVDVDYGNAAIDFNDAAKALSNKTKAVIVVHPFGHPIDINELKDTIKKDVVIIEDAATALGARIDDRYAGNMADFGCFSFHPRKLLTTGEGGMIIVNGEAVHKKLKLLRDHGKAENGTFTTGSLNFRLSDVNAAMGLVQFKNIEEIIERRRRLASIYHDLIEERIPDVEQLTEKKGCRSTYQSYVIMLPKNMKRRQKRIIKIMKEKYGIEVQFGTYALHLEPSFRKSRKIGPLSTSRLLHESTLTLPLYGQMTDSNLEYIVEKLNKILKQM